MFIKENMIIEYVKDNALGEIQTLKSAGQFFKVVHIKHTLLIEDAPVILYSLSNGGFYKLSRTEMYGKFKSADLTDPLLKPFVCEKSTYIEDVCIKRTWTEWKEDYLRFFLLTNSDKITCAEHMTRIEFRNNGKTTQLRAKVTYRDRKGKVRFKYLKTSVVCDLNTDKFDEKTGINLCKLKMQKLIYDFELEKYWETL